MNMCKARWIRNNSICHKWVARLGVRHYARVPETVEHLGNHLPLGVDVSSSKAVNARDESWVLDHVCHKLGRVASDRVKLYVRGLNKGLEKVVGG